VIIQNKGGFSWYNFFNTAKDEFQLLSSGNCKNRVCQGKKIMRNLQNPKI